eukprot:7450052-Heterocapsa_arctica.AAC.1
MVSDVGRLTPRIVGLRLRFGQVPRGFSFGSPFDGGLATASPCPYTCPAAREDRPQPVDHPVGQAQEAA